MTDVSTLKTSTKCEALGIDLAGSSAVRILAVDDNEALRYSIVRFLREVGYQVAEAKTGGEALAFAAELPDLITLDVNLPDIHGFQVCRLIKDNPATAHIPILHLSSTFVDADARVQGLASGADAYLAEPIDRAELLATINALLRLKQAENEARRQAAAAEKARKELAQFNDTLEIRVSERTAELKSANQSLRELSVRLLQMQDDERKRIARELHDSVGQLLAGICMNIGAVKNESHKLSPKAANAAVEISSFANEIVGSIRTISYLLHPPLLEETGLPSALVWYVEGFVQRSGIKVSLDCSPSFGRFSHDLETTIFRIIQECLGNIHRHSHSPSATIRLSVDEQFINLVISDLGRGIPPEKLQQLNSGVLGGVGLRGIRERVTGVGGQLQIESNPKGTTMIVNLPCGLPAASTNF